MARTRKAEKTAMEKLDEIGISYHEQCYFIKGTGFVVRMQKGPINQIRGQNGITKAQLEAIYQHARNREELV